MKSGHLIEAARGALERLRGLSAAERRALELELEAERKELERTERLTAASSGDAGHAAGVGRMIGRPA